MILTEDLQKICSTPPSRISLGYPLRVQIGMIRPAGMDIQSAGFRLYSWKGIHAYTVKHLCYQSFSFEQASMNYRVRVLLDVVADGKHSSLDYLPLIFTWAYVAGIAPRALWARIPTDVRALVARRLGTDGKTDPTYLQKNLFLQKIYRPVGK